jgi:hypothetical protein
MKFFNNPDGLEGYTILVEEGDLKRPLDLPKLKCFWTDILWEGVTKKDGHYHVGYLTNNEFAFEFLIPDADWLEGDLREALENALV